MEKDKIRKHMISGVEVSPPLFLFIIVFGSNKLVKWHVILLVSCRFLS